jgi:translation initiation factor IF-2
MGTRGADCGRGGLVDGRGAAPRSSRAARRPAHLRGGAPGESAARCPTSRRSASGARPGRPAAGGRVRALGAPRWGPASPLPARGPRAVLASRPVQPTTATSGGQPCVIRRRSARFAFAFAALLAPRPPPLRRGHRPSARDAHGQREGFSTAWSRGSLPLARGQGQPETAPGSTPRTSHGFCSGTARPGGDPEAARAAPQGGPGDGSLRARGALLLHQAQRGAGPAGDRDAARGERSGRGAGGPAPAEPRPHDLGPAAGGLGRRQAARIRHAQGRRGRARRDAPRR